MRPRRRAPGRRCAVLPASRRARIVFVDGVFAPELSDLADLRSRRSRIGSMAEALANGDPHLAAHLGKLVPTDDVAVALNTAFMGDGAVIRSRTAPRSRGRSISFS